MSRVLTSIEVAGKAIRMIGRWPITETAPDPESLREALGWLDLNLAQTVGVRRMFKRLDVTLTLALTNGTQSYDLEDALGVDLPDDGVQFVVRAWLEDSLRNRRQVEIVTREKFEDVSKIDESGTCCRIYIDRQDEGHTLQIFPVPATTDSTVWSLKLVVQRFAPDVSPTGVLGDTPGNIAHGFGQAWQRWIIFQMAHDLGCGAIHKLPEDALRRYAGVAKEAKDELLAFENREQDTEEPICAANGWM